MQTVIRSLTAALLIAATVAPSVDAAQAAGANPGRQASSAERDAAMASHDANVDRQEKVWSKLSASICVGCITAANRVAPANYERQGTSPVTEAKVEKVKAAVKTAAVPRKFTHLRKRYAKLHRRERQRLAARARMLRAAMHAKRRALRLAAAKSRRSVPVHASVVPAYMPGVENRVYRFPVNQPWTPRDDGRWRETILPTVVRMRRT